MQTKRFFTFALAIALCLSATSYQTPAQELAKKDKNKTITPAATSSVTGSGTVGRLSKWSGVSGSTTFVLGDSNIFEDKFGKVGIGTTTPTSLLTVQGMIETTLGGYKFPDGTVQSSAFSPGLVVSSLNGLKGDIILAAGANITIIPSGNTLTISAAGALTGVTHDSTLTGNGTAAAPLGVAVPLVLTGLVIPGNGVITARNTNSLQGIGLHGIGDTTTGGVLTVPVGVQGDSDTGIGVFGNSNKESAVYGASNAPAAGDFAGVKGFCRNCSGVFGKSINSVGMRAESTEHAGLDVNSTNFKGVQATGKIGLWGSTTSSDPNEAAVVGVAALASGGGGGIAGNFLGNVKIQSSGGTQPGNLAVAGTVSKGAGSFKIDHPLDPENKYLYHSFVESPDMKNIYDGNIVTDADGNATVELPAYFEALNRDFRYQLTVIGTFAQAIIADEIRNNRFTIKTNGPNVKVSWQVTGIRQDAFANKHRIPVEEEKPEVERGYFLHPEVFKQAEERGVNWARDPEGMRQLKEHRKQQPNQR